MSAELAVEIDDGSPQVVGLRYAASRFTMDTHAIALAVPFFFLLIAVEAFALWSRRDLRYRFHDAVNSLSCGIGQQVLGLFFYAVQVAGYAFAYDHLRLQTVSPRSIPAWVVLLFAVDLGYYAYHRASHRVNFFWATHAVHHQSEEYNLSTALRQSWFTSLTSWIFYVPIAIAGYPPLMFVAMLTLNTLYQFWIHTRIVGKIGFLEAFLNTPSHHRVHHGVDPIYIDKNYAGIFIVWDRLFGTFGAEIREPVYGTVKPLASWNPLWANLEPFARLVAASRQTRRWRDKLLIWFMPPERFPDDLGGTVTIPEVSRDAQRKYDTHAAAGLDGYVAVSFVIVAVATTLLLWFAGTLPLLLEAALTGAIVLALMVWGALFEGKVWAVPLEWARLALGVALVGWLAHGSTRLTPVVVAASVSSVALAIWVARYRPAARGGPPVPDSVPDFAPDVD